MIKLTEDEVRNSAGGILGFTTIGKNGEMLKQIGMQARRDIEELLGVKVMLELFVKVKKDWKDDASALNDLGFNKKDI